jgi:2-iminobutanoate/2-iminopropanoate deaminase
MMRAIVMAVFGLVAAGSLAPVGADTGHDKAEYLTSPETAKLKLPFSEAVRVGNVLYLSGMVALTPGTLKIVPGGIEAETKQVLQNISAVLERNGSSMDEVVKCTVLMADMAEWPKMNAIYATMFPKHFPARSALGVTGLALGARVEIECIATVGK